MSLDCDDIVTRVTLGSSLQEMAQIYAYKQGRAIRIGYCIVFTILVSIGFTQYSLWVLLFSQYNITILLVKHWIRRLIQIKKSGKDIIIKSKKVNETKVKYTSEKWK